MRPEEKVAARIKQALLNDKEAKAPAFLGNHSGTVQADNSGMVYVTLLNGEVLTVYNGRVPNVPRLFVSIGYGGSKRLQVLEQRDVFQGQKYPDVPNHASLHTFPGADTVPIRGEQFLPGLVTPKTGVTVRIYGMPYELADGWHVLTTQDLDLTSSIPSSGAQYARLEADDTGAVTISLGSAVGARGELEFSDIPAADPDKFSLAAVKLYAGQTSLIFLPTDTDIIDLRFGRFLSIDASLIPYTPAVPADWDGSTDPGNVDNALDQLAERVTDVEAGGGGGTWGSITGDLQDQEDLSIVLNRIETEQKKHYAKVKKSMASSKVFSNSNFI